MDCCLPGSSVHGISQARALDWAAISFSRGSSPPRDRHVCTGKQILYLWTIWEAQSLTPKSKELSGWASWGHTEGCGKQLSRLSTRRFPRPADHTTTPPLPSSKEKSNLLRRAPGTEENRSGCCSLGITGGKAFWISTLNQHSFEDLTNPETNIKWRSHYSTCKSVRNVSFFKNAH